MTAVDDLIGVRNWSNHKGFDTKERAVLAAADEIVRDGAISAGAWASCKRELGVDPAVLIELVIVIGTWQMIASTLPACTSRSRAGPTVGRPRPTTTRTDRPKG
jgi:alkylhydroperoxidase family enzyme